MGVGGRPSQAHGLSKEQALRINNLTRATSAQFVAYPLDRVPGGLDRVPSEVLPRSHERPSSAINLCSVNLALWQRRFGAE
jgi:hypothetical protein